MIMELYSTTTRIAYLIWATIMLLTGVPGNCVIIFTILRSKRLRNIHDILVVLLAVIDILLIGYMLPFNMYILITNVTPGRIFCKINGMICDSLFIWSIQFIMLIAVSRYVKICDGAKFNKIFKMKTVCLMVIIFFIIAFSFCLPLWFYDYLLIFDRTLHFCVFDRYGNKLYSLTLIVICLVLPISVTSICYIKIYLYVRKSKNQLYKQWNNGLAMKKLRHEIMSLKPQFVVFVAYLVLYFPFALTSVVGDTSKDFPEDFHSIGIYMCYLSSCINIFIYGVLNQNMRDAFLACIPLVRCQQNNQVEPLS